MASSSSGAQIGMKIRGLDWGESSKMGFDNWSEEFGTPRFQAIYRFLSTICGGTRRDKWTSLSALGIV
jgi:hypothetical protein